MDLNRRMAKRGKARSVSAWGEGPSLSLSDSGLVLHQEYSLELVCRGKNIRETNGAGAAAGALCSV